ncbi:Arm DNA-binding domain-containing protein [Paraburkholderia sediminicola]|uniref:Arm DNA-binding domain-containing protein n=2 Tax=Burkholderiaceae TaxID=119060 RepID=UPI0038BD66BA
MYPRVSVSGSKVWKFDYRLDGKDCSYTLGQFPALSLKRVDRLKGCVAIRPAGRAIPNMIRITYITSE